MPAVIAATLAVGAYSLWVRRDTWRSRWEVGASLAVVLEACALLLMSPDTSPSLGPALHRVTGLWNVQHLLGHLCLIVAIAAIIHHALMRIADEGQARTLFHNHVLRPLRIGLLLQVVVFVVADLGYHRDLFSAAVNTGWLAAYWVLTGGLVIYLSGYAGRLLLIMHSDPRARATVDIYLASAAVGVVASLLQISTVWTGVDVTVAVWLCACLAIAIFAYGAARSWRAKVSWFTPGDPPSLRPRRST